MAKRRRGFDRRGSPRPVVRAGRAVAPAQSTRRGLGTPAILALAAVLVAVLGLGLGAVFGGPGVSPSPIATATAGGVPPSTSPMASATPAGPGSVQPLCEPTEQLVYHVHSHLNIRVDGQLFLPPEGVGTTSDCIYWLHTHAGTGVIHVESPTEAEYTLGQFFDIWGKPLSTTQVGDHSVSDGRSLFVFIDRQRVEDVDPRTIVLGDLVSIELQIGNEPLEPLPYTFPPEFQQPG